MLNTIRKFLADPNSDAAPWWSVLLSQLAAGVVTITTSAGLSDRINKLHTEVHKLDKQGTDTASHLASSALSLQRRLFVVEQLLQLDPDAPAGLADAAARGDIADVRAYLRRVSPDALRMALNNLASQSGDAPRAPGPCSVGEGQGATNLDRIENAITRGMTDLADMNAGDLAQFAHAQATVSAARRSADATQRIDALIPKAMPIVEKALALALAQLGATQPPGGASGASPASTPAA